MTLKSKNTLLDTEYFDLISTLHDFSEDTEVKYAIVGGGAIQAYLADILTNKHGNRKPKFESIRDAKSQLEHVFRPTDDIDIVMLTKENPSFFSFNLEQYIHQNYQPNSIKPSHKAMTVSRNGHQMRVQLATDPKIYRGFEDELFNYQVESANKLKLIYDHRGKGKSTTVFVPKPEVLVLPKISRFNPGDIIDLNNLTKGLKASGIGFDRAEVRGLVKEFAPERADILMSNLDTILNNQ